MSDSDSDSVPSLVSDSSSVPEDPDNEDTDDAEDSDSDSALVDIWKGNGQG